MGTWQGGFRRGHPQGQDLRSNRSDRRRNSMSHLSQAGAGGKMGNGRAAHLADAGGSECRQAPRRRGRTSRVWDCVFGVEAIEDFGEGPVCQLSALGRAVTQDPGPGWRGCWAPGINSGVVAAQTEYHKMPGANISLAARREAALHFPSVWPIDPKPLSSLPSPAILEDLHPYVSRELFREGTPKIRLVVSDDDQTSWPLSRRSALR